MNFFLLNNQLTVNKRMLETFSNKNNHPIDRLTHLNELSPSKSRIIHSQNKEKCVNCHQNANIICYACCFQVGCQKCFDSNHFINCERRFNKYTINLTSGPGLEQSRTKRNGKKSRVFQKCKRCESPSQQFENCLQCKTILCRNCSDQIHSKGKFVKHQRCLSLSPQKKKTYQTILTQNCQENLNQRKENLQTFEYGLNSNKQQKSKTKVSNINKMGRSIAKVPFQNQQNTPNKKYRRNSMNQSLQQNIRMSKCQPVKQNYQKWQLCQNHNKLRNVLTQTYDLVCGDCYEQLKNSFSKLKIIDSSSWMKSETQKQALFGFISVVIEQSQFKSRQISNEFKKYRQELSNQLNKKCQMLQQRFRNNILSLQKWQNQYHKQLQEIKKSCTNFISLEQKLTPISQSKINISGLLNLHAYLLYEKILKEKRQLNSQMQQYQFRVSQINSFQFEEILKNFSFTRRKIDIQSNIPNKIINKMSQSHQLRQSRVSNTSLTTDRKQIIKRQESSLKSNYYELSNGGGNLMKRSMSKETKQDLTKDISQRVLFPITNVRSDKKQKVMRQSIKAVINRNSNYFFESVTDQSSTQTAKTLKKEPQVLNFGHKEAKYINLETIITQKLDKNQNNEKRDKLQLSTPSLVEDNLKKSIYLGEMTQQLPRNSQSEHNKYPISDQRSTYSIAMTQSMTIKNPDPANNHSIVQSNANLQSVKNKRKSDYMQMRDRLRKPNLITKMGK